MFALVSALGCNVSRALVTQEAAAPACSVHVSGALTVSAVDPAPSADVDVAGASANDVGIVCAFAQDGVAYSFLPILGGVTGPGTYVARSVRLSTACQSTSCPGDYSFEASAPAETCTFVRDTFSPETRGGMTGHFMCPRVPIEDFENPQDTSAVTITGSFDFPPIVAGAPLLGVDGGAPPDPSPPSCTMRVSDPYGITAAEGIGFAVNDSLDCDATMNGVSYSLTVALGDFGPSRGTLGLTGGSFCTSNCYVQYDADPVCVLTFKTDAGIGGRFAADFVCNDMYIPGLGVSDGGHPGSINVAGSIDGIHRAPPPVD